MENQNGVHYLKYLEIYKDLKDSIETGKYLRGSYLPAEAELMRIYESSRTTVRKAISLLEEDKLIRVQRGRGTEVISGRHQLRSSKIQIYHDVEKIRSDYLIEGDFIAMNSVIDTIAASGDVARYLEVPEGTEVYQIRRLKIIANSPFNYVKSFVPVSIAPDLEKFSGQVFFLYRCLKESYGIVSTSVKEYISADTATYLESSLLGVPVNAPLLLTRRVARYDGGVMEYTESRIRTDLYRIEVTMRGGIEYEEGN